MSSFSSIVDSFLQYYMDLAGNIRRGPAPGARGADRGGGCHRNQALLSKFERRLERDKRDLIKVIIQLICLLIHYVPTG